MSDPGWTPVDHACKACGGRILRRGDSFLCSGCETTSSAGVEALCCCGLRHGRRQAFHCVRNPAPVGASPHRVIAQRGPRPAAARP